MWLLKTNTKKTNKKWNLDCSFFNNWRKKANETKQASYLLVKFINEGKLSKSEKKRVKASILRGVKLMGLGIPFFIIPFASVLVPFSFNLSTKFGMDILPISFKNEEAP